MLRRTKCVSKLPNIQFSQKQFRRQYEMFPAGFFNEGTALSPFQRFQDNVRPVKIRTRSYYELLRTVFQSLLRVHSLGCAVTSIIKDECYRTTIRVVNTTPSWPSGACPMVECAWTRVPMFLRRSPSRRLSLQPRTRQPLASFCFCRGAAGELF